MRAVSRRNAATVRARTESRWSSTNATVTRTTVATAACCQEGQGTAPA